MATLTKLRLDKSKQPSSRITVEGSGAVPHCFRGNATTYRVAIFLPDGSVADLGDHSSLNLAYMPVARTGDAVALATSGIEDATFTEAEWLAGAKWHAEFDFDEADMNPLITGISQAFWLVCYGILTATGYEITHGGSSLMIEEDGTANTVEPPPGPDLGVTAAQATTLIAAALLDAGVAQHKIDATTAPTAGDDSDDGYSVGSIWIDVTADAAYICVDATEDAAVWLRLGVGFGNPMSAAGDIIIGGTAGAADRLAKSDDGKVLKLVSGSPAWADESGGGGMANPMSAAGDIIIGGTAGAAERLAKGTDGKVLKLVSGSPAWDDETEAGMANPMSAAGDIIIGGTAGAAERLAKGTDGKVLKLVSGSPAWADESGGGGGAPGPLAVVSHEDSGALTLGDANKLHTADTSVGEGAPINLSIPVQASVAWAVGTVLWFRKLGGSGDFTVDGALSSAVTVATDETVAIARIGSDTWTVLYRWTPGP